jgi:hypothetical protein
MKRIARRSTWGLLLIAGGVVALLVNLSVIPNGSWVWAGLFLLGGIYFLFVFFSDAEGWWAAFPAFASFGIAGTIVTAELAVLPDELAGAVFLGMISLAFFAIFLRKRENWWALIPGGATLTIAGVVLVSTYSDFLLANLVPVVLFGGIGLTFFLVYLAPAGEGRNRWAIWPALGMLFLALLTGVTVFDLAGYIVPIVLIGAGILILLRRR